jgi:hypothetical protein
MDFWGGICYNGALGDVLHRRSEYFKKLQAGFDP